jgi:hypothetical protein
MLEVQAKEDDEDCDSFTPSTKGNEERRHTTVERHLDMSRKPPPYHADLNPRVRFDEVTRRLNTSSDTFAKVDVHANEPSSWQCCLSSP